MASFLIRIETDPKTVQTLLRHSDVRLTLQCQLNITVAKQSLYRFWVSSNANQKRCQAVTQIMEAESPRVVIYQFAFVVPV